jgi:predicted small integral membrane protein
MPHEPNAQSDGTAETAETDTGSGGGVGVLGSRRVGAVGRTGSLAFTTVGGRRFLLTLVSGAGTFLLCWQGKISDDVYSVVTIATVAAYITNNTYQKVKAPETPNV